jgi:hypothetical protein
LTTNEFIWVDFVSFLRIWVIYYISTYICMELSALQNIISIMRKIAINIFLLLFVSVVAYAQPVIVFEAENHDFGNIIEGAKAKHDFKFTNKGNAPLIISGVRPSCGCTTPTWSKEPIKPGESGFITAEYDSENRPGAFIKSISVWSNAENSNVTLTIKGVVTKETATALATNAVKLSLHPAKEQINLGKVERGQWVPFQVEITNPSKELVVMANVTSNCNCVRIDPTSTRTLEAGKTATVKLLFQAQSDGQILESLSLISQNAKAENVVIKVQAEAVKSLVASSPLKNGN